MRAAWCLTSIRVRETRPISSGPSPVANTSACRGEARERHPQAGERDRREADKVMKLTSILTKVVMALTGLVWAGFVVTHLAGNLFLLRGPEAFNRYSATLHETGPLLLIAEAGLLLFLVMHVGGAIRTTLRNRQARPVGYETKATFGQASLASRSMVVGGVVLFIFLIIHIRTFKFAPSDGPNGLWGVVVETFQNPIWVAWYILAMAFLGLHLSHGFGSAFQTLGVFKPSWRAGLKRFGLLVGWAIAAGFMALPLWAKFIARS